MANVDLETTVELTERAIAQMTFPTHSAIRNPHWKGLYKSGRLQ
jgi:hypothetical protein